MAKLQEPVSFWRSFGVSALCWTAMGLINGRMMFVNDHDNANFLPYAHYFVWAAAGAFSWAMVTPIIFLFARRYPFQRQHWVTRTAQYILLTCVLVIVQPALMAPGWFYGPDRHQAFADTTIDLGKKNSFGCVQTCLLLYLLAAYQNTKREARWRQLREADLEAQVSNAELNMLRMQLHPHFLFNTLQAATVLVHEDPVAAENVLHRLSELLRVALDDMRSLQVPLQQEVSFLEHYVGIQKQRFQERLTVRFHVPSNLLSVSVPTLLLQPLVENAIHHGIGTHKGSDIVEISASQRGQDLVMEIRNSASSFVEGAPVSGQGVGLKNTRARLEQMYGDRATLSLAPLEPSGVCTTVTLPMESTT